MRTLIKIAWRNIWRNTSRSLILILAIVFGLVGGNFIVSIYLGLIQQNFRDTIERQISHIQIHDPDFVKDNEAQYRIADGLRIAGEINRHPDVKSATARTVLHGMAASPHLSTGIRIVGVHPDREIQTTGFDRQIEEGTYFTDEGRLPSVVIGRELAGKLRSGIGSRIVLTFMDIHGEMISSSFRIEGIYAIGKRYEERMVFVHAKDINELIGDENAVTEIAVLLHDNDAFKRIADELEHTYAGLTVRSWDQLAPDLRFQLEVGEQSVIWIIAIILFGVAFGILNSILMSIFERTRELGMLLSIGMKKIKVFGMVIIETVLLSLTGGVIGLVLSFGLVSFLQQRGVDLSAIGGENLREVGFPHFVYPELALAFYFQVAVLVVFFAVLASIYPAIKAIKLVPAEAVRQE